MMKLTKQLAQYYRATRQVEPQFWLWQHWLPQGEQRIRYLQWLLEPVASAEQQAKQPEC